MMENSSTAPQSLPSVPSEASDDATPAGDSRASTAAPTAGTGTSVTRRTGDDLERHINRYWWKTVGNRDANGKPRIGSPEHPLNAKRIELHLGCIPGICQVTIDPWKHYGIVEIRHEVPQHLRSYVIFGEDSKIASEYQELVRGREVIVSLDIYLFERYDQLEDVVRMVIEKLSHTWNAQAPHHA